MHRILALNKAAVISAHSSVNDVGKISLYPNSHSEGFLIQDGVCVYFVSLFRHISW